MIKRTGTQLLAGMFCVIAVMLLSCSDKKKGLQQAEMRARVDSIVGIRLEQVVLQNNENLSYRMTVEVKQKADSILAARMAAE